MLERFLMQAYCLGAAFSLMYLIRFVLTTELKRNQRRLTWPSILLASAVWPAFWGWMLTLRRSTR